MKKDSLGDRIKKYESCYNFKLPPKNGVIIRLDGKAFHTYTANLEKPFSTILQLCMIYSAIALAKQMQGFKLAYIQSDEVTFLLTDTDKLQTQGWFNYELNKILSISASIFTAYFNQYAKSYNLNPDKLAFFDSRVFIVPKEDIPNVFIWRYKDWIRNSVSMLAQFYFSHRQLQGCTQKDMHEMLHNKGINWTKLDDMFKNGTFILKNFEIEHCTVNYEIIQKWIENEK